MGKTLRSVAVFALFIALPAVIMLFSGASCADKGQPALMAAVIKSGEETQYYALYENGRMKKTDAFRLDRAEIYRADSGDFSSEIKDGKVTVALRDTLLRDAADGGFQAEGIWLDILKAAADQAEHDIFSLEIIHSSDRYYVFEKLNVNMWTPCRLFAYDEGGKQLVLLGEWDDVELAGLAQPENVYYVSHNS